MYIDVHKAIRRMAPAPKAKVHKGQLLKNSNDPVVHLPEDQLIDITEDATRIENKRRVTNGDSPHSAAAFGSSPKTTFLRRSSSGADGHAIMVRGNANDMREHLKHLGPSNLASRPKTTRYQSVKIKPGFPGRHGSTVESTGYSRSIIEEPYEDNPALHAGEGEGLLKSAASHAKDGVQAVQQGYGSMNYSSSPKNGGANVYHANGSTSEARPTSRKSSKDRSPPSFVRRDSDRSSDTIGSLQSGVSPTRRRKGTARSGSITENIRESGGFQKVVLETTSSDDVDEHESLKGGRNEQDSNSTTSKSSPPAAAANSQENASTDQNGDEVKKKRRRHRKKKGGKSGEEGSNAGDGSVTG